ncbi:transmembrane protein, putative (macronuclear) [Tetrahymena thermophila SB210]|uniref:Transmembrane protein, putative n=1 Tax=Tetrahymena thermophila (strain SB210) TaxID=312017 RepID=W7XDW8_TETTS|nr:transmembrane protein, putative [Tetrahymena thermophila SB210]EWS72091.1 transmembrane protein, putative [Tetrahymena thermophila SB210]|eukprot:XP_012655402.1 transmembrane protein, putative [Tetrahymena thermophila SB210]
MKQNCNKYTMLVQQILLGKQQNMMIQLKALDGCKLALFIMALIMMDLYTIQAQILLFNIIKFLKIVHMLGHINQISDAGFIINQLLIVFQQQFSPPKQTMGMDHSILPQIFAKEELNMKTKILTQITISMRCYVQHQIYKLYLAISQISVKILSFKCSQIQNN